jgi:SAM-dependent methyltransferase
MIPRTSLSFSVRRHFVDQFFFSKKAELHNANTIIDIGGKRTHKRGLFNIDEINRHVTYVNIEKETHPDILADAASIPLPDNSFNIVLMGEVLEHIYTPLGVLKEAYRLLQPGGKLFATVPFLFPVHGDPNDYGRYTASFWKTAGKEVGFSNVHVEAQGTLYAVQALLLQHFFRTDTASVWKRIAKKVARKVFLRPALWILMKKDSKNTTPFLTAWTTGFGITMVK